MVEMTVTLGWDERMGCFGIVGILVNALMVSGCGVSVLLLGGCSRRLLLEHWQYNLLKLAFHFVRINGIYWLMIIWP